MWVAGRHWCEPRGFQRCKTMCEPNCESKMHCVDGRVCVDIYCSVGACSLFYCICLLQMQIQFLCICLVIWKGIWLAPSHLPFQSCCFSVFRQWAQHWTTWLVTKTPTSPWLRKRRSVKAKEHLCQFACQCVCVLWDIFWSLLSATVWVSSSVMLHYSVIFKDIEYQKHCVALRCLVMLQSDVIFKNVAAYCGVQWCDVSGVIFKDAAVPVWCLGDVQSSCSIVWYSVVLQYGVIFNNGVVYMVWYSRLFAIRCNYQWCCRLVW